jgi:hypothetical protein
MRARKEIEKAHESAVRTYENKYIEQTMETDEDAPFKARSELHLEVLLDIRDILLNLAGVSRKIECSTCGRGEWGDGHDCDQQ